MVTAAPGHPVVDVAGRFRLVQCSGQKPFGLGDGQGRTRHSTVISKQMTGIPALVKQIKQSLHRLTGTGKQNSHPRNASSTSPRVPQRRRCDDAGLQQRITSDLV